MNESFLGYPVALAARCIGALATIALLMSSPGAFAQSPAPPYKSRLNLLETGQYLSVNEYLYSPTKRFFVILQTDGNLCEYRGTGPTDKHGEIWCAGSNGAIGSYFAIMQGDGNFCVYRGTGPQNNKGNVWCIAGKALQTGHYFAILDDDDNFSVWREVVATDGTPGALGKAGHYSVYNQFVWHRRPFREGDTQH